MGTQDKVLDGAGLAVVNQIIGDKLDKKQDKLAAGDGTTVAGNKVNVNTPVQGVYTQAEYDALPEEQKNKGMYVIPDAGGGPGGGSSGEIYFTEETRIGTWIDGKPIYRKIMSANVAGKIIYFGLATNVDILTNARGILVWNGENQGQTADSIHILPSNAGSIDIIDGEFRAYLLNADMQHGTFYGIFEYTKTTDTAPTQEVAE